MGLRSRSPPKINNRACVAVNTVLSKYTMNNPMRLLRSTSREKKKSSSLWKKWTRWDWTKKIVIYRHTCLWKRWVWMKKIVIYKAQLANPVTAVATVATARVDTAVDMVATARVEVSAAATRASLATV